MTIRVQLFAVAKQAAAAEAIELSLAEGATVADVRRALVGRLPTLAAMQKHLLFAVNADYASDATVVKSSDEVACIPPVSGG